VGDGIVVHNSCWGGTFRYAKRGVEKAIDHIWALHSYANRSEGVKSYFLSKYSTQGKIKDLVSDAVALGSRKLRDDGTYTILVDMGEKIGKNKYNRLTSLMTIHLDGKRIKNAYPGK